MPQNQLSEEMVEGSPEKLREGRRRARTLEMPRRPMQARMVGDDGSIGLDKPIYTLSVASEILDTHPRTLMMYEHLGMIKPHRTSTNRRRYSQRDMMKLQAIQTLTRQHRVNLAGARYILEMMQTLQSHELPLPDALGDLDARKLKL
jgi:DNA-binding transcriptional MerR regulator